MNIIDWKAVKKFVRDRKPVEVSAGIVNDWFWTAATVYENGKWVRNHRAYVTSDWASPGFKATLKNGDVVEVVAYREATKAEVAAMKRRHEANRKKMHKLANKIRADRAKREAATV